MFIATIVILGTGGFLLSVAGVVVHTLISGVNPLTNVDPEEDEGAMMALEESVRQAVLRDTVAKQKLLSEFDDFADFDF